ncbi:MAG: FecR family protein [Ignavibacteria bacterium]
MKKINAVFSAILFLGPLFIFAQTNSSAGYYSGEHDSLLFDGGSSVTAIPTNIAGDCKIMVTYVYGTVEGTFYKTEVYEICGEVDTSVTTKTGQLEKNNVLKLGEEITTGDNSNLELEFWDGSTIKMGPNSKIKISGDMCDRRTLIEQTTGKVWTKVKKLLGGQKYEVKTDRNGGGVRGTEFSIEITGDEEIIRVFEGSFEVHPPSKGLTSSNDAKNFEQATKDYQTGKITMEEYIKITQEFQKGIGQMEENMKSKMCEAGYMVHVTDKISDPIPIGSTGNDWFDDVNFKK